MKTLLSELQKRLAQLEHRQMMLPRYLGQPEKFVGRVDYSPEMIVENDRLIEETKAAIKGIEDWRKEKQATKP